MENNQKIELPTKCIIPTTLPPEEFILKILRWKKDNPYDDIKAEVEDFKKFMMRESEDKTHSSEDKTFKTTQKEGPEYALSYYFDLLSNHLRMKHIMERAKLLAGILIRLGGGNFGDWGAGAGRECIIASRLGFKAHHIDIKGEGTKFANMEI